MHSGVLDSLRASAALVVLLGHAVSIFPPAGTTPPTWLQQFGVAVFFLLSGYLISQTLRRRLSDPTSTFKSYAIDRFARIYSGYLPALLLVAAIDHGTRYFTPIHPETAARLTWETFGYNLFMLQAPFVSTTYGSASPFWTIAIEFWIYFFVGLLVFSIRDGLTPIRIAAIAALGIIPVLSISRAYYVFVPWLLGAACEHIVQSGALRRMSSSVIAGMFALSAAIVAFWIARGDPYMFYNFDSYILCAIAFLFLAELAERRSMTHRTSSRFVTWWAAWSYSLYLIHHSILMNFNHAFGVGTWQLIGAITASIIASIAFATVTEMQHRRLAKWMKGWLGSKKGAPAEAGANAARGGA